MSDTYQFNIAGVQFHQYKSVVNKLQKGDELTMEPEPTNKYDANAVKLTAHGFMVGYVPGKISADVSATIEINGLENMQCILDDVIPSAKPWDMFTCTISKKGE